MTTLHCSQKLEKFLGKAEPMIPNEPVPVFGNWNGHSFHIDRKRCLLFLNSKTCYCILMIDMKKAKLGDIRIAFRERLIQQLNHDFPLTEAQEISIRNQLSEIRVCKTNNDRNVNGTMNQWIYTLPLYCPRFGPVEGWDELFISHLLNDTPVTAKVWANKDKSKYFTPREAMRKLVDEPK